MMGEHDQEAEHNTGAPVLPQRTPGASREMLADGKLRLAGVLPHRAASCRDTVTMGRVLDRLRAL